MIKTILFVSLFLLCFISCQHEEFDVEIFKSDGTTVVIRQACSAHVGISGVLKISVRDYDTKPYYFGDKEIVGYRIINKRIVDGF